jgi:hypothetical protein
MGRAHEDTRERREDPPRLADRAPLRQLPVRPERSGGRDRPGAARDVRSASRRMAHAHRGRVWLRPQSDGVVPASAGAVLTQAADSLDWHEFLSAGPVERPGVFLGASERGAFELYTPRTHATRVSQHAFGSLHTSAVLLVIGDVCFVPVTTSAGRRSRARSRARRRLRGHAAQPGRTRRRHRTHWVASRTYESNADVRAVGMGSH